MNREGSSIQVVGIGASAGGLDALKDFFAAMPADNGMAFVVIQHLDPAHVSYMAGLARQTYDDSGSSGRRWSGGPSQLRLHDSP